MKEPAMEEIVRRRRRRFPDDAAGRREQILRSAGLTEPQRLDHLLALAAFGAACAAVWPNPLASRRLADEIEQEGNRRLRDWARRYL